jgi:NADH-quinone oxidoreductase subunit N
MMGNDWITILPYLFIAGGGTLIFCAGAFCKRPPAAFLLATAILSVLCAGGSAAFLRPSDTVFMQLMDVGEFARYFTLIFSVITLITLLFSFQYARSRNFSGDEFYGLILFAALGMMLTAAAANWLIFFLGLELLSVSFYIMIAVHKSGTLSIEAALKYFIMGTAATAFLVFGIAMMYGLTGTLQMGAGLSSALYGSRETGVLAALAFILAGIGFKLSIVPFHLWTPDVYQGGPAPVIAFLASGSKVALFAVLLRMCMHLQGPLWEYSMPAIWLLAAVTMAAGTVTALSQTRVKRLLAYSSIAQIGFLFMTLPAVKEQGLPAMLYYLAAYAIMDLGVFGTLGTLSAGPEDLDDLESYRGIGYTHPYRSAILAFSLFSLAGFPPTAGFVGKFLLFRAVLQSGFVVLALIGILAAIISIYFYMRVIMVMYMRPAGTHCTVLVADITIRLAAVMVFMLILWMGIMPSTLFDYITRTVSFLPVFT